MEALRIGGQCIVFDNPTVPLASSQDDQPLYVAATTSGCRRQGLEFLGIGHACSVLMGMKTSCTFYEVLFSHLQRCSMVLAAGECASGTYSMEGASFRV